MSTSINRLNLFTYDGQYQNARRLDPYRAYQVPATQFSPGFTVNGGPTAQGRELAGINYGANANGQVTQTNPRSLDGLMAFGNESLTTRTNQTYEGVTRRYSDYVNGLSMSENNFDQLSQQPFSIYNGRVGINVDANNGNIEGVSINPRDRDQRVGLAHGVANPNTDLLFPNLAEISQRAQIREANDLSLFNPTDVDNVEQSLQAFVQRSDALPAQPVQATDKDIQLQLKTQAVSTEKTQFQPFQNNLFNPLNAFALDPVRSRIQQFLPPGLDATRISGIDSEINADMARQLSAVNAGLGVNLKNNQAFNAQLAQLREAMAQQEAMKAIPERIVQARTHTMPANPFLPAESQPTSQVFTGGGASQMDSGTSMDTANKRGSGGLSYMPSYGQPSTGGESGAGQQQERRRPFRAIA